MKTKKKTKNVQDTVQLFDIVTDITITGRGRRPNPELEMRILKSIQALPPPAGTNPSFLIPASEGKASNMQPRVRRIIKEHMRDAETCYRIGTFKDANGTELGCRVWRTC